MQVELDVELLRKALMRGINLRKVPVIVQNPGPKCCSARLSSHPRLGPQLQIILSPRKCEEEKVDEKSEKVNWAQPFVKPRLLPLHNTALAGLPRLHCWTFLKGFGQCYVTYDPGVFVPLDGVYGLQSSELLLSLWQTFPVCG